jgi:hypothetical protein
MHPLLTIVVSIDGSQFNSRAFYGGSFVEQGRITNGKNKNALSLFRRVVPGMSSVQRTALLSLFLHQVSRLLGKARCGDQKEIME